MWLVAWWIRRLKSGDCYFLIGKERLLKKDFILDLQKKFFPEGADRSLNTQEWDVADTGQASGFTDFIQTAPFLAPKRMAILWQIEQLDEEYREAFLESLQNIPSTGAVVLASEETGTKKSRWLQSLEACTTLVACHTPFEKDLPAWIQARAKKMGGSLEREAISALIQKAGKEPSLLQNALETLLLYAHPRTTIQRQDIDRLLGQTSEEDVFALAEDIFEKNTRGAIQRSEALFREGVRVPELIGVLTGQFERMKQASDLLERGASPSEVANTMRVHSFFQQKFFQQLKKVSKAGIIATQKQLLECDLSIKQGRLAERLAFEKFLLGCPSFR